MSNTKNLRIILNITFILMISCSDKLFGSTHFLKPMNKTNNNVTHKMNFTLKNGNFTIENSDFNLKNNSTKQDVMSALEKAGETIAHIMDPFLRQLADLFRMDTPIFSPPDFMGKKANFDGNGTYTYRNFTNGQSLEIHIEGISLPSNKTHNHMKNVTFHMKNDTLPLKNGTYYMKTGTFHLKNGTLDTKNGTFNMKNGTLIMKNGTFNMKNGTLSLKNVTKNISNSTLEKKEDSFLQYKLKNIIE